MATRLYRSILLLALVPGMAAAQAKKAASAAKPAKPAAPAGATTAPGANAPDPPTQRTVIHTEAYKKREYLGPHINFKVTPPEDRGAKGRVLVEVYNYSKTYLNVVDFWLYLSNTWGDKIEVHITCDDIKPNWSALRWVRIPGAKQVPKMDKVEVKSLTIFDESGKQIKLKHFTDLIKK